MPLITERAQVLEIYQKAAARRWVIPTFCSENLTTTEAILSAVKEYGEAHQLPQLPVSVAITNLYDHRSQTLNYTRSGSWLVGLKLFMADLQVLCGPDSPFAGLRVMAHLDHIQPQADADLLNSDLRSFSSIMFDASTHPFEENMRLTADFMQKHGGNIVVEGACDEIVDAAGDD
ncbi:MAG: class II fructose-bisphosphate aldolase, partial [Lentisphaerae bacterium]|nr:class II fructose-bisphosphate aldolase [Lentisphaerota bacterium]